MRRQRGAAQAERGAASLVMVAGCLALAVVMLGAIALGRIAAARADAQRAADAALLGAAALTRERGLPIDGATIGTAELVARRNTGLPMVFDWAIDETAERVGLQVTARAPLRVPRLAFSQGQLEVRARAVGALPQQRFDEAERRFPRLVLALDYSGSMQQPFSGGGARAIDVLEDSVGGLLGAGLRVDYGAAFYSTDVFRTVGIGAGAPGQIQAIMDDFDAGGTTNTGEALARAGNLLEAVPNSGYHVLLVSDGEPCCTSDAFARARAAAVDLWERDVTIFTLEIRRQGSSAALSQLMTDVAGSPTSRRDPGYHFVATTAQDLIAEFENIVASIVCKVGPLTPTPGRPDDVRVFLRTGASEQRLPASTDLAADRTIDAFRYEPADETIRLTEAACDRIVDGGAELVVRVRQPVLTE